MRRKFVDAAKNIFFPGAKIGFQNWLPMLFCCEKKPHKVFSSLSWAGKGSFVFSSLSNQRILNFFLLLLKENVWNGWIWKQVHFIPLPLFQHYISCLILSFSLFFFLFSLFLSVLLFSLYFFIHFCLLQKMFATLQSYFFCSILLFLCTCVSTVFLSSLSCQTYPVFCDFYFWVVWWELCPYWSYTCHLNC